jgi:hypothetical protein
MKKTHKIVMLSTKSGETELYKGKKSKVLVKSSHRRLKEDPLDNHNTSMYFQMMR